MHLARLGLQLILSGSAGEGLCRMHMIQVSRLHVASPLERSCSSGHVYNSRVSCVVVCNSASDSLRRRQTTLGIQSTILYEAPIAAAARLTKAIKSMSVPYTHERVSTNQHRVVAPEPLT